MPASDLGRGRCTSLVSRAPQVSTPHEIARDLLEKHLPTENPSSGEKIPEAREMQLNLLLKLDELKVKAVTDVDRPVVTVGAGRNPGVPETLPLAPPLPAGIPTLTLPPTIPTPHPYSKADSTPNRHMPPPGSTVCHRPGRARGLLSFVATPPPLPRSLHITSSTSCGSRKCRQTLST